MFGGLGDIGKLTDLRRRLLFLQRRPAVRRRHGEPLQKLPHRYPFLLVDRVLELERDVRIKALKTVNGS